MRSIKFFPLIGLFCFSPVLIPSAHASDTVKLLSLNNSLASGSYNNQTESSYLANDLNFDGQNDTGLLSVDGFLGYETATVHGLSAGMQAQYGSDDQWYSTSYSQSEGILEAMSRTKETYSLLNQYYLHYAAPSTRVTYGAQSLDGTFATKKSSDESWFRGVSFINTSLKNITLRGYYITDYTDSADEEFVSIGNFYDTDKTGGVYTSGISWKAIKNVEFDLFTSHFSSYINEWYSTAKYSTNIFHNKKVNIRLRHLDQHYLTDSLAANQLTRQHGTALSVNLDGATVTGYYGSTFESLVDEYFGNSVPSLLDDYSSSLEDDNYAIQLSYNFKSLGLDGLSVYVLYGEYFTSDESTPDDATRQNESYFNLTYKIGTLFKKANAKMRYVLTDDTDSSLLSELRFYLKWQF